MNCRCLFGGNSASPSLARSASSYTARLFRQPPPPGYLGTPTPRLLLLPPFSWKGRGCDLITPERGCSGRSIFTARSPLLVALALSLSRGMPYPSLHNTTRLVSFVHHSCTQGPATTGCLRRILLSPRHFPASRLLFGVLFVWQIFQLAFAPPTHAPFTAPPHHRVHVNSLSRADCVFILCLRSCAPWCNLSRVCVL